MTEDEAAAAAAVSESPPQRIHESHSRVRGLIRCGRRATMPCAVWGVDGSARQENYSEEIDKVSAMPLRHFLCAIDAMQALEHSWVKA
jgi:hypothetical protein